MTSLVLAALISTLHVEGDVAKAGGDYLVVPFDVPAGTVELEVARVVTGAGSILDFGVWDERGAFRGWSGGLTDPLLVGVSASSRGYLPGPITPGTWQLMVGKAKIESEPVHYSADFSFRDASTITNGPRAPFGAASLESRARWYKGDFHVHSRESGDASATFDEITALARSRGLDFVVLTDHNTVSQHSLIPEVQKQNPKLLILRGIEVTTYAGHGNAVGVSQYIDHRAGYQGRTASQMIREANGQGGLFIVNHPVLDLGTVCIGCAWKHDDTPWKEVSGIEIQTGSYKTGITLSFTANAIALWDRQLDAGATLTPIGGSDDHRAGKDMGGNSSQIGSPTTLVWADELSESAIVAGVRAGRTVVQLQGPDDPLVELTAGAIRIGGSLATHAATLGAHVAGGAGRTLVLVRNGVEGERIVVDSADWNHDFTFDTRPEGDRYRLALTDGVDPLVVTGHIFVSDAEPTGCAVGWHGRPPIAVAALALLALAAWVRRSRARPRAS